MPLRPRPPGKAPGAATRTLPARAPAARPQPCSAPARRPAPGPGTWLSPSLPIAANPLAVLSPGSRTPFPGAPRALSPHPQLSPRPGLVAACLRPSSKTPNAQTLEPERGPQTKSVAAPALLPCCPAPGPGYLGEPAARSGGVMAEAKLGSELLAGGPVLLAGGPRPRQGPLEAARAIATDGRRTGALPVTWSHLPNNVLLFQGLDTPSPSPRVPDPKDELLKYPPTSLASLNTSGARVFYRLNSSRST